MADDRMEDELRKFLDGKPSDEGEQIFNSWFDKQGISREEIITNPSRLQEEIKLIKANNSLTRVRTLQPVLWRAAAAVVLLAVASGLLFFRYDVLNRLDPVALVEQQTQRGERVRLDLSDGTQVWLNAESKFSFPKKFKRGTRDVYLEGEAFFNVAKDARHPFIIHTKTLTTQVVGTSFNVRAYPLEEAHEVSVCTGKVSVSATSTQQNVIVTPGQQALYRTGNKSLQSYRNINTSAIAAWKDDRLVFDAIPLAEVSQSLNRFYNVNIRIPDASLATCKITAEFDRMTPEELVTLLCRILNGTYVKKGNEFYITGPGCK